LSRNIPRCTGWFSTIVSSTVSAGLNTELLSSLAGGNTELLRSLSCSKELLLKFSTSYGFTAARPMDLSSGPICGGLVNLLLLFDPSPRGITDLTSALAGPSAWDQSGQPARQCSCAPSANTPPPHLAADSDCGCPSPFRPAKFRAPISTCRAAAPIPFESESA
jgi:hypothetical protein